MVNSLATYQFRNVIDVFAQQHGHAHLYRPLLLFFYGHLGCGCVRQELQTCLIEVLLVVFSAVVCGEVLSQRGDCLRVDVRGGLDLLLDFV